MKRYTSIALVACLVFVAIVGVIKCRADDIQLYSEFTKCIVLNERELSDLLDFQNNLIIATMENNPTILEIFINNTPSILSVLSKLDSAFASAGTILSSIKWLFDSLLAESRNMFKDAFKEGKKALVRAKEQYRYMEKQFSGVQAIEFEFQVFDRYGYDDNKIYRQMIFIHGGGDIIRIKTRRGWITSNNPLFVKKKEEMLEKFNRIQK